MTFIDIAFILFFIAINIARLVINAQVYRVEYDSDVQMDDIAEDFNESEIRKRDEAGVLFLLSLFTIFWLNYSKEENGKRVLISNVLSVVFLGVLAVYFIYF